MRLTKKSKLLLALCTVALGFSAATGAVQAADTDNVNNFTITSYKIDYYLSRDVENRSTLNTKETIVADFPQSDQNHGLERAITKDYDGHSTGVTVTSVTDGNGKQLKYRTNASSNFVTIRIGDADTFVHGIQTYVIKYTQRDVTKDEFYWDTNGTDWKVPIKNFSFYLHTDPRLTSQLNDDSACYQGKQGSQGTCRLYKERTPGDYSIDPANLNPGENVTVAIGFKAGTFAGYSKSLAGWFWQVWITTQIVLALLGTLAGVWLSKRYDRLSNRSNEQGTIIAEYLPPKNVSVATSAQLLKSQNTFAPQILDLAVRRYVKIIRTNNKDYSLEVIGLIDDLRPEEQEFMRDVFDGKTAVGSTAQLSDLKKQTALRKRLADNSGKLQKLERHDYQLRHEVSQQSAWFTRLGIILYVGAALLLSPVLLLLGFIAWSYGKSLWPLTDDGLQLVRYLKGLKLYIKTAEQDRLNMLQSPEGAQKVNIDTTDNKQMVQLYERLLPYAVLFGQGKQWNKELGKYYADANIQPNWYIGTAGAGAYNASTFVSDMNSFTASAASASATGGSGGGGYSGGGGGGGGGGGW